ncbi:MAG TPA: methyltransferase domain-containing protein [Ktedonobacterales bacterium]|nr:methyltransferase domain-containing protein [Ktedonobacterales bacterium]
MAKHPRRSSGHATDRPKVTTSPREGWGTALEVGGVVQSVSVPAEGVAGLDAAPESGEPRPGPGGGYWGLMLPASCPRRALLLGLGGGTVAALLARRCPDCDIVGVERSAEVLVVSRSMLGLDAIPRLTTVQADAFAWVEEHAESEMGSFDLVCLDLFEAGRLAQGALATPFLRQLATLLAPGGTLSVNLMVTARTRDQLARLRHVFTITRELRLRGNLVAHAIAPADGR